MGKQTDAKIFLSQRYWEGSSFSISTRGLQLLSFSQWQWMLFWGAAGFNIGFSPFSPRISQLLLCIRKDPNTQELLSPVLHYEPITTSRPACTGVHAHTGVHA